MSLFSLMQKISLVKICPPHFTSCLTLSTFDLYDQHWEESYQTWNSNTREGAQNGDGWRDFWSLWCILSEPCRMSAKKKRIRKSAWKRKLSQR